MKKMLSMLLVAAMLVTSLAFSLPSTAVVISDSDLCTNVTGEIDKEAGTLTVTVSLQDNPGLWAQRYFLYYNKAALTLEAIENGNVWNASQYVNNSNSMIKGAANPITYYAECKGTEEVNSANGTVATYTFRIVNEAANFNIKLSVNNKDVFGFDANGQKVQYKMQLVNDCPLNLYTVTINGETFSYPIGSTVEVSSDFYAAGGYAYRFDEWTGNVDFADATSSTTTFVMPAEDVEISSYMLIGDINGDGSITSGDSLLLLQMIVGKIDRSPIGDINGDGIYDATDSLYMLQYAVKKYVPEK